MSMDMSLGEFSALTAKAFRGAGYSWGLASDGAYAARTLARNGHAAAEIVARLLVLVEGQGVSALMGNDSSSPTAPLCPISLGAALSDLGGQAVDQAAALIGSRVVIEPLLLAGLVPGCVITWDGGQATADPGGIHLVGDAPSKPCAVQVTSLSGVASNLSGPNATRASVDEPTHKTLLTFAARTYAPATEASRASGAGEGP